MLGVDGVFPFLLFPMEMEVVSDHVQQGRDHAYVGCGSQPLACQGERRHGGQGKGSHALIGIGGP